MGFGTAVGVGVLVLLVGGRFALELCSQGTRMRVLYAVCRVLQPKHQLAPSDEVMTEFDGKTRNEARDLAYALFCENRLMEISEHEVLTGYGHLGCGERVPLAVIVYNETNVVTHAYIGHDPCFARPPVWWTMTLSFMSFMNLPVYFVTQQRYKPV